MTPAIAEARHLAARVRIGLAAVGAGVLAAEPSLHPHPGLAVAGLAILAVTGILQTFDVPDRWLRIEETVACVAGVLIVTFGAAGVTGLTLLWMASVATGVVARGGRVGAIGRILIVAILASPLVLHGVSVDGVSLLAAGLGLLLTVGRISVETSELLRDPLTGVLSRGAFETQVERWARHASTARPAGLIMIDLDDFGSVNKRHGHRAGDLFLQRAVGRINGAVRGQDLVGRVGGDEFAILTAGEPPEALAQRIVDAVAGAGIGASAGVAFAPRDGSDMRTLFAAADVAMRRAKRQGKGCVSVYGGPPLEGEDVSQALARLCR
ncbi:MAG: hypothetical protein QOF76_170, partial [Solirubrobacteraceae bacterium]|nr:hypothetical protein [Solirubrobacteraceae bacterium]